MRRKEKEINERERIDHVIAQAEVCRLGLCKDNRPYVVPLSFGYDGKYIYFHTAREGTKIDYMLSNPQVCFEFEHDVHLIPNESSACKWSVSFYSVIGFGTIGEVTGRESKIHALNQIVRHYSGRDWDINLQSLENTRTWRIAIEEITGKQSNDKAGIE